MKARNFVQENVQKFNVPTTFVDHKVRAKKGYTKHKKNYAHSEHDFKVSRIA